MRTKEEVKKEIANIINSCKGTDYAWDGDDEVAVDTFEFDERAEERMLSLMDDYAEEMAIEYFKYRTGCVHPSNKTEDELYKSFIQSLNKEG